MIAEGSIDVLLRNSSLNSRGTSKASFEMFEPEGGQDLTLSPQTFTNSTEAFINDNSNSLGVPATDTDTVGSTEEAKVLTDSSKLLIKRSRPKASSPNRQGPQQCQEFDRAQPGKVCGKVFGNASALAKHKLTHSDERKYACNVCGKAFKRQDHLNGHMLTHRNKKPYECKADGCGKSYCDARSLRRHTENHHSGGGVNLVVSSTSPPPTCIQYAPPSPAAPASLPAAATQLQRLLSLEPSPSTTTKISPVNDGLTKHQLELIQQIMQHTQQKQGCSTSSISSCDSAKSSNGSSIPASTNSSSKNQSWTIQTNSAEMTTTDMGSNSGEINPSTFKSDPKPVECNLCHRKFKNVPALNGHMRLHGGYFKKESDARKCEKKEHSGPPLQTASMSVRALIEEKIIQKRITSGCGLTQNTLTYSISTIQNHGNNSRTEKPNLSRRHSDSQFCNQPRSISNSASETPSSTMEQKHVSKTGVRRASSDPGSLEIHSRHLVINDEGETLYPLSIYSNDSGVSGYLSTTMHEEVFKQVQSVEDSMLLHGVDPKQLAESIQVAALQDIENLDDCQGNYQDEKYQQQHDMQSTLTSPLTSNMAKFGYPNNQSSFIKDFQSSESTQTQSMQSTSVHIYPSSCGNQEQPLSVESSRHVVSLTQTAPLSSTFYNSTMSSSAAFEGSFNDACPLGSNQPVYPPPQSPLSAIPISSPLSLPNNPSSPISQHTLQSQMMPNSDDPLLSSSPKDFACKKRFDFQTFKFLNNGTLNLGTSGIHDVTGVVVDRNGELKLIHTAYNFKPVNTTTLSNGTDTVYVKTRPSSKSDSVDKQKGGLQESVVHKIHEINSVQLIDHIKEEIIDDGDVFLSPSSISANHIIGAAVIAKKRPRADIMAVQQPYHSKLRTLIVHQSTIVPLPYTPPPMLLPSRNGQGLYWQAISRCPSSTTMTGELSDDNCDEFGDGAPESDVSPHINIGHQFQCSVPAWLGNLSPTANCDSFHEHLLWDPGISKFTTESEVDMYLEFACCAAVPGGGRNKEYALHLLNLCHGNIHDAMLKLMQPTPLLPPEHSLISFEYTDCDRWSDDEIDSFHKGLHKFDKDFTSIAYEVGTKNAKQCVQFYYLWKKICPEDYKRIRLGRRRNRESDYEFECVKSDIPVSDWDMVSTSSESRLFVCEYPDCSASFNSRAALNGHIRIHGGGVCVRSPTPDKRPIGTPTHLSHSDAIEEFPCKICGKIFNKVKSRSAHMKSHRPPDAEPKKAKQLDISVTVSSSVSRHM